MADDNLLERSAKVVQGVVGKVVETVTHILPHRDDEDHEAEQRSTETQRDSARSGTTGRPKSSSARKKSATTAAAADDAERPKTKAELYELARERGIPGRSKMSKAELEAALR